MLTTSPRLELLSDLSSIEEDAWQRLVRNSPTCSIFQTLPYLRTWWSSFGRGKLLAIAAYEQEQLIGVAPLLADHGMVFFVGSGGSDYLDFIGREVTPSVLADMLKLAIAHTPGFVGLRFYHVPDASPTGRLLASTAGELGLECFDEGWLEAPALRFADWPADSRLPAEKKSLLRHERGLQKAGRLEVEHFINWSDVEPLLTVFFDQHVARWAETPFPSLFLDEQQRIFYRQLAQSLSSKGWLRFTRVSLDNVPIAFHFGFSLQNRFLWYKPSFDIRLARQSPGEVLLRSLILWAQEEGSHLFDFGLGDEPFKQRFSTETNLVRTWGLYPANGAGFNADRRRTS